MQELIRQDEVVIDLKDRTSYLLLNGRISKSFSYSLARMYASKNNDEIKTHLGSGQNGCAYLLGSKKVLKITTEWGEAAFAYKSMLEPIIGYVKVYSVHKLNDDIFLIIMEHVDIDPDTYNLGEELDEIAEDCNISFNEPPSLYDHLIEDPEILDLCYEIYEIIAMNPNDEFVDIHVGNYGRSFSTGLLLMFDQSFDYSCKEDEILKKYFLDIEEICIF